MFRRKKGSNIWHFCEKCSKWPTSDYESSSMNRTIDELCNECLEKEEQTVLNNILAVYCKLNS